MSGIVDGQESKVNSDKFLLVHGEDPERWADRFGIKPMTAPCDQCGAMLDATIPFVYKTFRGLRCPRCQCGNKRTPYCLVRDSRYGDLFTEQPAPVRGEGDCKVIGFRNKGRK